MCQSRNARDHVGGQTLDSHRGETRLGAIVRAAATIYVCHERIRVVSGGRERFFPARSDTYSGHRMLRESSRWETRARPI